MWADAETSTDFLNYSEVAELAVDLLRNPRMLPVSIGVFGTWGTGKSTLLNLIENALETGESERFIVVRFDAWLYQGYDDARAALMEVIAQELWTAAKGDESLTTKAKSLLGRVDKLRLLGLAAEGGALAFGFPAFGALSKAINAAGGLFGGHGSSDDVADVKAGAKEALNQAKGLVRPEDRRTAPQEIAAFRQEFGALLAGLKKTLVVFVDNLDRCMPRQTIHTLEALRIFLFVDKTAFVVAADEEMVRTSVSAHFGNIDARHVTDYLDKLIQVPIRVPMIGVQEVRAYLYLLYAQTASLNVTQQQALRSGLESSLQQGWRDAPITRESALALLGSGNSQEIAASFETADRMAPLLAAAPVHGNPRIVKRLLNVVRLRSRLAQKRAMPLDEPLIVKLALFERCTDAATTSALYKSIQEAAEGKPELLKRLEASLDDPAKFEKACPDSWRNKHGLFLLDWIGLEPKLAGVDLRPALYLSRETIPVRVLSGSLSRQAADTVRKLLEATTTNSPMAKSAIDQLSSDEATGAMTALIAELRKVSDWSKQPSGFIGAHLLALRVPPTLAAFAALVADVQARQKHPWLTQIEKTLSTAGKP